MDDERTGGKAAAAARMMSELPDGVDLVAADPGEVAAVATPGLVADQDDPRWGPAVRGLAAVMLHEIRPEDASFAGRGKSQLVGAVAGQVPEVAGPVIADFVGDYVEVRAGYSPRSGRSWQSALGELREDLIAAMLVDLVGATYGDGLATRDLYVRAAWLGVGRNEETLGALLAGLTIDGRLVHAGDRYRHPDYSGRTDG